MKKIIVFIAVSVFLVSSSVAQENITSKFWDNWFVQIQTGISYTASEYHSEASFSDIVTPHIAFSAGKFFTPNIGARLQIGGWESKNYYTYSLEKGTYKIKYMQFNVDGLIDIISLFTPDNGERRIDLIGIAGFGYARGFKNSDWGAKATNNIVPRLGLKCDYRINESISLGLELTGNLYPDSFNGYVYGSKNDGIVNALIGLTYRLGK